MTRIGIFGGTFDPPHRAHVMAMLWALQSGEVDHLLVLPTASHPFGKQPEASFADRLAMCRLALDLFAPGLVDVSDIESTRPGPSYMIDTVRHLQSAHPGDSFRLVVGTDIVADLPAWREGTALAALAPPLVVPRIVDGATDPDHGPRTGALPALSSSTVRDRARRGEDIASLLPARVLEYARAHRLYGLAP